MKNLIDAVSSALQHENWTGALAIALTIPDIAGRMDLPGTRSGERYRRWFETYIGGRYRGQVGAERIPFVFLSGNDCYALRCALLHEGRDDITEQRCREALDGFHFVTPRPDRGLGFHIVWRERTLLLDVFHFCNDITNGATRWLESVKDDARITREIESLLTIHPAESLPPRRA